MGRVYGCRASPAEVVEREIDPKFEITALTEKLEAARRRPILELRGVKGTDFTVVTNVFAKRSRLAFALGTDVQGAVARTGTRATGSREFYYVSTDSYHLPNLGTDGIHTISHSGGKPRGRMDMTVAGAANSVRQSAGRRDSAHRKDQPWAGIQAFLNRHLEAGIHPACVSHAGVARGQGLS